MWMRSFRHGLMGLGCIAFPATVWAEAREFTREQVSGHKSLEDEIWVTFEGKVYNVTEFVESHPGGSDKILLAAGGALEPFWAVYRQHSQKLVRDILAEFEIGTLSDQETFQLKDQNDPFANEPDRHPALRVRVEQPFNAETPIELIPDSLITPNGLFFVRNHLPVPEIKDFRLELDIESGLPGTPLTFTLEEIQEMPKTEIIAAVQCAGNRRSAMNEFKTVHGTGWTAGAISNAKWGGVRLCDVLRHAGVEQGSGLHVQFEGCDSDAQGSFYGASIPLDTALDRRSDVLLVYEMNDEPLPADHGFPLRVLVPGHAGARNVKWLRKITVSREESHSHFQRNDYKGFSPSVDSKSADWENARAIQEFPVQSAICEPRPGKLDISGEENVNVRGYAISGGGREITRVDVSIDGEKWFNAELEKHVEENGKSWGWTLWRVEIPVSEFSGRQTVELVCKAVDVAYNEQPESFKNNWNFRGLISNAWDRVKLDIEE